MLAAVKSVMTAGRSLSRAVASPGKHAVSFTFPPVTPLAGACVLARAGGFFPLLLWWSFSVARGVLPVVMSWLLSRYSTCVVSWCSLYPSLSSSVLLVSFFSRSLSSLLFLLSRVNFVEFLCFRTEYSRFPAA